jgi:hypothetical protein
MGSETIRGFLQDNGLAVRSALRKEAHALEENDFIDMFSASDRNSGCLCKDSRPDAGADKAE